MATKYQVTAYVSQGTLAAIQAAASREQRSVSQWAGMVLEAAAGDGPVASPEAPGATIAPESTQDREVANVQRYGALLDERPPDLPVAASPELSTGEGGEAHAGHPSEKTLRAGAGAAHPRQHAGIPTARYASKSQQRRLEAQTRERGSPCFSCGCRGGEQGKACRLYGCACHKAVS